MNATLGIYDTHDLAVEAVVKLKDSGFPVSELSIIGLAETEVIDDKMHIMPKSPVKAAGLGAGTALGTTLGILTGIGVFAIPGVGFLYGAGALVGAIAGFDFGIMGGGVASAIATAFGIEHEVAKKYHSALVDGKFIVAVHGKSADIDRAKDLLNEHGTHTNGISSH